ncbi:unnamed protein product [Rotaria sordida]|uniref:Uncharacterized protein n=1 Tax=Rotaria sordida TaxID=392033 RepID=A0A814UCV5_9BILA|nr:unnamed protein product [Rotaria sordida]
MPDYALPSTVDQNNINLPSIPSSTAAWGNITPAEILLIILGSICSASIFAMAIVVSLVLIRRSGTNSTGMYA